jgi:hypothetical protein
MPIKATYYNINDKFKQQILQAQQTVDSWSSSRISNVRLEGYDIFLNRLSNGQLSHQKYEENNEIKI